MLSDCRDGEIIPIEPLQSLESPWQPSESGVQVQFDSDGPLDSAVED